MKIQQIIIVAIGVLIVTLFAGTALAQTPSLNEKQALKKPTPEQILERQSLNPAPAAMAPPPGPVHCVAEWEESEGILTLWQNADLMYKLQQEHQVYIPVDNQTQEDNWITYLNNHSIPLTNFHFLYINTNTIWTRDYGPWFIWDANNEMGIVNYTCNYGYWDDKFPSGFAAMYGINYYESGLYHVGGNYYPNAYGRAFSSTHVYESNSALTKAQVDARMDDYFGIERYQTVAPKDIWHHDTWGKPADPETLIIVDFPEYDTIRHAQADGMVAHYSSLQSPWGRPYKIHRLPMMTPYPGSTWYRPYMNSLVSNQRVFVPIHECEDDVIALGVFQDAFVGYEVIGVVAHECEWHDALHCRTRNFVKREQIRLYPYPPGDTEVTGAGYPVVAEVIPPNGSSLLAGFPKIHWTTTGGEPYTDLVMTATGQPNEYAADIPAQAVGTTLWFYIEAQDDGGLDTVYPPVAPDGLMQFTVRADSEAPALSRHVPVRSAFTDAWSPQVRTLCIDDMATPEVTLEYAINGIPQPDIVLSKEDACFWYSGAVGGAVTAGDVVRYCLKATDYAVAPNESVLPLLGDYICPVSGPGSIAVVDLCSRPYTGPFLSDALGDLGLPYHCYHTWPSDWSAHDVWFICLGVFADNYVLSSSEAGDIVAALQAGAKIYLEGGNTWCNDPEKNTLNPWFGVQEDDDWDSMNRAIGLAGTFMEGISLPYASEDLQMDAIEPASRAEKLMESNDGLGRVVTNQSGGYKTVASTFALGGILDSDLTGTRKEMLVRYLEYFGMEVGLYTDAEAVMKEYINLYIRGIPGDTYRLLGSLAENYVDTVYGLFRLDKTYMFSLWQGVIPGSGTATLTFRVPDASDLAGIEVHVQAVVGEALTPSQSQLTNREVLTLTAAE